MGKENKYKPGKWYYFYGMKFRGFSPGCQPMDGLIDRYDHDDLPFSPAGNFRDILAYDHRLSYFDEEEYELEYIGGMII